MFDPFAGEAAVELSHCDWECCYSSSSTVPLMRAQRSLGFAAS